MPQDFFADGFGEQQGIVFSKQEDDFLQKKIVFLDPMKTYQISIAKVLALLKYTKLDHESIKKIIQNSCANGIGQKVLTHDEMKKVFRGVALKQNKMEPSKINIEANIKTRMPIFYDDDDQSDEQQPQPTQQTQPVKPQQQKKPVQTPTQNPSTTHQPPKVQAPVDPLKAYDDYWKSLRTKNNLIDGAQVKKLFSNNNLNKANLSKSWKLCNISEKGSLTKGQFFIFMNLINSSNIPEALTKQMKDFIVKIQQACGYKKVATQQPTNQRVASGPLPSQKQSQRRPSDAFDKFGNDSLFAKNASKVQQTTKQVTTRNSSNVFPPVSASQTFGKPSSSSVPSSSAQMSKSALFLLQKVQNLSKQQKVQQKQIQSIAGNNQQLVTGLGAIQQFLVAVQKNMQSTTSQIQLLKQTQQTLNQRLNNVCLQFKNIITKQTQCINFMRQTMHSENESNNSRLQILENYTNQMLSIAETTLQNTQNQMIVMRNQSETNFNKVSNVTQNLNEKIKGKVQSGGVQYSPPPVKISQRPRQSPSTPEYQGYRHSDPFQDNQENQDHYRVTHQPQQSARQKNVTQTVITREEKYEARIQNQNQPEQQESHIYLQNLSPEERKKTKQLLLIRILNSVSSMNEEEYAQVVNKVVAMTEEQMNQSYTKLHALYLQSLAKNPSLPKYPVPTPQQFTMPQSQ